MTRNPCSPVLLTQIKDGMSGILVNGLLGDDWDVAIIDDVVKAVMVDVMLGAATSGGLGAETIPESTSELLYLLLDNSY